MIAWTITLTAHYRGEPRAEAMTMEMRGPGDWYYVRGGLAGGVPHYVQDAEERTPSGGVMTDRYGHVYTWVGFEGAPASGSEAEIRRLVAAGDEGFNRAYLTGPR